MSRLFSAPKPPPAPELPPLPDLPELPELPELPPAPGAPEPAAELSPTVPEAGPAPAYTIPDPGGEAAGDMPAPAPQPAPARPEGPLPLVPVGRVAPNDPRRAELEEDEDDKIARTLREDIVARRQRGLLSTIRTGAGGLLDGRFSGPGRKSLLGE